MEIRVEITKESYMKNLKTSLKLSFPRIFIFAVLLAVLSSVYGNFHDLKWNSFSHDALILLIIYLLAIYIITFIKSYKRVRESLKKLNVKGYFQEFALQPDGININSEKGNILYKWFEIRRIISKDNYIIINLRNKLTYGIPKYCFANSEDLKHFLEVSKKEIIAAKGKFSDYPKPTKKAYYFGFWGLVPVVGTITGTIMIIRGISIYKDIKYTLIGVAGVLFNLTMYYLSDNNKLPSPQFLRSGFTVNARMQLNSLVKEIEFYKLQNGKYPDSLQQLNTKKEFIDIYDPVASDNKAIPYNYQKTGLKYTLFSSGVDRISNTGDDIYPDVDTSKTGLIIQRVKP